MHIKNPKLELNNDIYSVSYEYQCPYPLKFYSMTFYINPSNKQKAKEQRILDRRSNTRAIKRYKELLKRKHNKALEQVKQSLAIIDEQQKRYDESQFRYLPLAVLEPSKFNKYQVI